MGEKVINAALLGLGTVGTGVYKVLKNQEEEMTAKIGCKVKIRKILVRNLEKAAGKVDDPAVLTNSWEDIKADPSIDIIIELIGGIEPARTYILDALHAGKHVVTANKDLIAVHGKELMDTARASHVDFLFEAAVAGGIPIIRPLKQCLAGNHMSEVMGIVNGTTNFILTKMSQENMEFKDALAENQVEPENAYVALEGSEFTIVPETEGSKLKVKEAYKALDTAISGSQTSIDLGNTPDVYAVAAVTSDDPTLQATRDAYNNYTKASITYTFGEQTVTLDGSTLKEWLQFDDKGQLVQDDASFTQHIKDFVAQLASEHDTVGTTRSFNTTSGRTVSVYGSAYGWKIDQDAEAAQLTEEIRTGTQTTREPVYSMRANSYGYNDIGSTYIEVDLSSQHMYYYQNGSIIFDSDIVSGDIRYDDRATPPGIFTLYYKKSPDVLRGEKKPDGTYEYETQVTYWMPFNGGIGFHDATWQAYFGGDRYTYAGSHGCINMPLDAAATLYSIIDTNVPIVCFY